MSPQRIQLRRTKGWRKPEGAILVSRPSRWGNPYAALPTADGWGVFRRVRFGGEVLEFWIERVGVVSRPVALAEVVRLYRSHILYFVEDEFDGDLRAALEPLRGHDLACWCPLDAPCHADVLLELANAEDGAA